jgi:hypothetical protein
MYTTQTEVKEVAKAASQEESCAIQELQELQLLLVGGGSGGDPAFC